MHKVLKHGLKWIAWAVVGGVVCAAALHGKHPDSTEIVVASEACILCYPCILFVTWITNKIPFGRE